MLKLQFERLRELASPDISIIFDNNEKLKLANVEFWRIIVDPSYPLISGEPLPIP